jgi:hypothetical protein
MIKIAYISCFDFENSPAASNRFLSLYSVLEKKFQTTKIITSYPLNKNFDHKTENWKIRSVNNKILNILIIFKLSFHILKNANRFDIIIIYGGYSIYMVPLIFFKPFFKYKLVFDSVEIYHNQSILKTFFSPNTWNHIFGYNFFIRFFDGAICISSYLQKKHSSQGLKTVVIPPIFLNELKEIKYGIKFFNKSEKKIKILYYGFPGKKDLLNNLVKVFLFNKLLVEKFEVIIIGLNYDQFKEYCNENEIFKFPENFTIKGKLDLNEVYQELTNTDFSFLQRPYTLTTKAGFPSKIVESLAFKIPLILNLTSDMDIYEIEKCSVVCKDDSVESLENALKFITIITEQEKIKLKDNCKNIYERYFSTIANLEKIKIFIENIRPN